MLSIDLLRWYINITIIILDIIHRPVFYLKLNSILQICPYLTANTLRLRYEPDRLMLSICLWRWYINITITILDIIRRPVFHLKLNSTQGIAGIIMDIEHCLGVHLHWLFFLIPFYLQTVRVHSANGVTREACRGALSSTSPHVTGSKPCVSVGKMTY
jgi:hypothetical protein